MKVILHVGLHKTGTSAIQNSFACSRAKLMAQGRLYYPPPESLDAHHQLAQLLKSNSRAGLKKFTERLAKYAIHARNLGCDLLISSEIFSELEHITKLQDALQKCQLNADVLLYLRRPDHLYESVMMQTLRQDGQPLTPSHQFQSSRYSLDFNSVIARWTQLVGTREVVVRNYDNAVSASGGLIADVERALRLPDGLLVPPVLSRSNLSLTLQQALVLNDYCLRNPNSSRASRDAVIAEVVFDRCTDTKFVGNYLSDKIRNSIISQFPIPSL